MALQARVPQSGVLVSPRPLYTPCIAQPSCCQMPSFGCSLDLYGGALGKIKYDEQWMNRASIVHSDDHKSRLSTLPLQRIPAQRA